VGDEWSQRRWSRGGHRAVGGGGVEERPIVGGRTSVLGGLHVEEEDAVRRGHAEEETRSRSTGCTLGCPILIG
jgi:hypothetical protein